MPPATMMQLSPDASVPGAVPAMQETSRTGRTALITTRAMAQHPGLAVCLPEFQRLVPWSRRHFQRHDAILGWGYRPTTRRSRQWAQRTGRPYVALEDGFIRAWGTAGQGYASHSLVVDHQGIYYDATRPSDLETWIEEGRFPADEEAHATALMARIRELRLSKYNHAPDAALPTGSRTRVLVVDQTRDDASITFGMASADSFRAMLESALETHPEAEILVKLHPEVISGTKQGHLAHAIEHPRCRVITDDINPWALFDTVSAAHVVTSQLGFEALLAGLPVTCHGMPFYAGWGLTHDHLHCQRRQRRATLSQIFAAAYLRYTRYVNPYTGERSHLAATLELINDQRRQIERCRGSWQTLGFSRWKRGFIGDFLGPAAQVTHRSLASGIGTTEEKPVEQASLRSLVWASQQTDQPLPQPLWRMEDGFLRSVGLGVDLVRPLSLALDRRGIHYDPSRPSDLEHLLQHAEFSEALRTRAQDLIQQIVASGVSKYNSCEGGASEGSASESGATEQTNLIPEPPSDRACLLVVGQVESDASIRQGSRTITTNTELLARVRRDHPSAFILYKPHPDVLSGVRDGGKVPSTLFDIQVSGDITRLIKLADEVHTMTSLAGFEALIRGTAVVTYGVPFYAGWGLTRDHGQVPARRNRSLKLEELVAGALLLYPHYVDPRTAQPINAETAVTLLRQARRCDRSLKAWQYLYRFYRRSLKGQR
ncbi:capsular polysaccharide biosynthesis protein [Halomonas cupida]|uniref:capsular polysaccharide biosynthesis protein n=1 Tax=Halomonas cupida TaxID=44933 RepID=UPI003A8F4F07